MIGLTSAHVPHSQMRSRLVASHLDTSVVWSSVADRFNVKEARAIRRLSDKMARTQLRFMLFSIVCGLAAPWAGSQVTPPAQVPLSVTISAPSRQVKAGSEFKLDVVITNTSDEPVSLSFYPGDFRVDVRDSNGKAVGKVKQAEEGDAAKAPVPNDCCIMNQPRQLAPHEVDRWQETLDKNLDWSKPGKYTIQVTRMYGTRAVKSNTIRITVVP